MLRYATSNRWFSDQILPAYMALLETKVGPSFMAKTVLAGVITGLIIAVVLHQFSGPKAQARKPGIMA